MENETEDRLELIDADLDWLIRATHALLMALPRRIEIDTDTYVKVLRADDPDENPDGDASDIVSPLFVDHESTAPEILVALRKKGAAEVLFAIRQVGGLRVNESLERDAVFAAAPNPLENPQ